MKRKRLLCLFLSLVLLFLAIPASLAGCGSENQSEQVATDENIYALNQRFYDDKSKALSLWPGVFDYLLDAIKMSGKSMISAEISSLATSVLNGFLSEMGYDMRSVEQKQLDQISAQLTELQKTVEQGFETVKRNQIKIRNQNIMNDLLELLQQVDEITSYIKGLSDLSARELAIEENPDEYTEADKEQLSSEKTDFAKNCSELQFSVLSQNTLWDSCRIFAQRIATPYKADGSVDLWVLYEETYGSLETWDYMTVEPRTEFICYLAFLVNSMAELSKLAAAYKLEDATPSMETTIKDGVEKMADAVNTLNEKFKTKIEELEAIKKKHDEDHTITHRDRSQDSVGNIVITDGVTLSTRLLPVTTGNSSYNYTCFDHDEGRRESSTSTQYDDYIYNLDCLDQSAIYATIFEEYENYCLCLGYKEYDYSSFTIKDYLATVGFTCRESEKENFLKTAGFYMTMACFRTSGRSYYVTLMCAYNEFANHSPGFTDISQVYADCSVWTHAYSYSVTNNYDKWYLCFLEPDQKTIYGKVNSIVISHGGAPQAVSVIYDKIWHGANKCSRDKENITLLDEHR